MTVDKEACSMDSNSDTGSVNSKTWLVDNKICSMGKLRDVAGVHMASFIFCLFMILLQFVGIVRSLVQEMDKTKMLCEIGIALFVLAIYSSALYGNWKEKPKFYWPCFAYLSISFAFFAGLTVFYLFQSLQSIILAAKQRSPEIEHELLNQTSKNEAVFFFSFGYSLLLYLFIVLMKKSMDLHEKENEEKKEKAKRTMKLRNTELFFVSGKEKQSVWIE